MARYLTIAPYARSTLNFNKGAHLGSIPDGATVQVDQTGLVNHDIRAQADVIRDHAT
jgi:hypothetical protein